MSETRCEPPPELRGVGGWHWLNDNCPVFWMADVQEWDWTEDETVGPDAAYRYGYRYAGSILTPAEVAALRAEVARLREVAERAEILTHSAGVIRGKTPEDDDLWTVELDHIRELNAALAALQEPMP